MWVTVKNKQCDAIQVTRDFVIVDSYGCERLVPAGHWLLMLETGPVHLDDATFKAMFLTLPVHELSRFRDITYTYPPPSSEHWIRDARQREADAKE